MTLAPGTRVRARLGDPDHHTRLPAYVRGQTGEVVEAAGLAGTGGAGRA